MGDLIESLLLALDPIVEVLIGHRLPRSPLMRALVVLAVLLILATAVIVVVNWHVFIGARLS